MVDEILAKSKPFKTLKEHTQEVLENFKLFRSKNLISLSDSDWEILNQACLLHDLGKANTSFQKKIRGENEKDMFPHNYFSVAFIKEDNELLEKIVAFHHWKEPKEIKEEVYRDFLNYFEKLNKDFGLSPKYEV